MPLVVVAIPMSTTANSYLTRAEANSYFEGRLHTDAWDDASDSDKDKAIVMATRLLDNMFQWAEYPTESDQALQWPRIGLTARGGLTYLDQDTVPIEIKNATAEFAMQLLGEDRTLDYDVETKGIQSLRAGSVSLSFRADAQLKVIPNAVKALIPRDWYYSRGMILELERA